jgi:hypothetical protein
MIMKKIILLTLVAFSGFQSFAQDTTWVQTFTFDSIETRRANFQFPASLDNQRFEKVLMYYKLKCSPLTTWDNYNCGEWDYLTYTRIFEHTGIFDSVQVDGNRYRVNLASPATYPYTSTPYYDQQTRNISSRTQDVVNFYPIAGTAATDMAFVQNGHNGGKLQWVISASELASAGIVAGDIQAMQLDFLNTLTSLQGFKIRMKSSNLSTLTNWESAGFTTVYDANLNNIVSGTNSIDFSAPFAYDGTSNIVIEVSYDDARTSLTTLGLSAVTTSSNTLSYDNSNGTFHSNGTNYAEINMSNVDLGDDITIEFWAKGEGNTGVATSILEAVDSLNDRSINIHMPWSDNTIYWDAGQGNGYDRISKLSSAAVLDNSWHHWAYVKKTSTGQMFIYLDGTLWHSGSSLNRPVGKITKFFLGANQNLTGNWKGNIDEFKVWSGALDAATILAWKDKKANSSHPNYSELEVYYDFDGQQAMIDRSSHNRLGATLTSTMVPHDQTPVSGTTSVNSVPKVSLAQGTMNAAATSTELVALYPQTSVVFEYAPADNSFHIVNNMLTYDQGTIDTLDVSGTVTGSGNSVNEDTLVNETITYYNPPFEDVNDIEIGRYITPYGIGFDLGPQGFSWIYDVTDYQQYMHGLVDLAAHNTQELLDLKFAFIEGIPPRDVHNIEPIWNNWASYNYGQMANDAVLQGQEVILSDTSEMFSIKTRMTGHGHNGNGNCCEWQDKEHRFLVDGVQRFNWHIWQPNECGENPNIGQGGTWPYAREGWCPGDMVKEYNHELTPYVTPGDTVVLDYDIEDAPVTDPDQVGGNYVAAFDLVSYSAPNFQNDAALVDVLNPNNYEYYSKWNPTCSNPRVIIQNTGEQPMTSCEIIYWVTTDYVASYTWNGNLNFLEKEVVELPITDQAFWFGAAIANGFTAQITKVNGSSTLDEYANNNVFKTKYSAPETVNHHFYAWYKTNNKAAENKWRLIDGAGNIIFERTTLQNTTEYKDTFDLAPGCYAIIIEDSDDDGIGFWYSAQVEGETSGNFRVREVGGSIVENFTTDFGSYHRYDFTVGFSLNTAKNEKADEFMVFPNPSADKIRVEYVGNLGDQMEIQILDLNGRIIETKTATPDNYSMGVDFIIDQLNSGMYLVRVIGEKGIRTTQFVKQ